jgi:hypothetical protein
LVFKFAVGNPWLCRRLFDALPLAILVVAAGVLFWLFQPCWEALQGSCALFFNYGTKLRIISEICKHL